MPGEPAGVLTSVSMQSRESSVKPPASGCGGRARAFVSDDQDVRPVRAVRFVARSVRAGDGIPSFSGRVPQGRHTSAGPATPRRLARGSARGKAIRGIRVIRGLAGALPTPPLPAQVLHPTAARHWGIGGRQEPPQLCLTRPPAPDNLPIMAGWGQLRSEGKMVLTCNRDCSTPAGRWAATGSSASWSAPRAAAFGPAPSADPQRTPTSENQKEKIGDCP